MASKTSQANLLTYQQIKLDLVEHIENNWAAGQRLAPIKKLAEQLGVGQSNLNRAIRELVREGLLVSRPGLGTYVRDPQVHPEPTIEFDGRCLARKRIVVMRSSPDTFLNPIIDGLEAIVAPHGASVIESRFTVDNFEQRIHETEDADAIAVLNPSEYISLDALPDKPFVIISTAVCRMNLIGGYDIVYADSRQGGVLVGRYAAEHGYERPCFIGVKDPLDALVYDDIATERLHGFETGYGMPLEEKYCLRARDYSSEGGARAVNIWMRTTPRPDLIFAASDDIAVGFVHGALAHGLEPGVDYELIGFDGQARGQNLIGGPLSTVVIPSRDMGHTAAQLLTERFLEPTRPTRTVTIAGTLFLGSTVNPKSHKPEKPAGKSAKKSRK